jgi:hypothetical protein
MSLFRRKSERGEEREERSEEPLREDRPSEPEKPKVGAREQAGGARGEVLRPVKDSVVRGVIEVEAHPAATTREFAEARLEWSSDGEKWQSARALSGELDIHAARTGEAELRHITTVHSTVLAEQVRRSLEQAGYGEIKIEPAECTRWSDEIGTPPQWDTTKLSDGEYLVRLVTKDIEGVAVESEPVSFRIDNAGPELRFDADPSLRPLEGLVKLTVEAADPGSGVELVTLEVSAVSDDWHRVAETREEPYVLEWDTTAFRDATYRMRIVAWDVSGNETTSPGTIVEVSNTLVAAELIEPKKSLSGRVNLLARAGGRRTAQMVFEIASAGSNDWKALGTTRPPFHLAFESDQHEDGSYLIRIQSVSSGGREVYSRSFGPYVVDNTAPTIEIVEPKDGQEVAGEVDVVARVLDDGSGVERASLELREDDEWRTLTDLEPESGEVRLRWDAAEADEGQYALRVSARDRAGNEAGEELELVVSARPAEPAAPSKETESAPPPALAGEPTVAQPPASQPSRQFGPIPRWRAPDGEDREREAAQSGREERLPEPELSIELPPGEPAVEAPAAPRPAPPAAVGWSWRPREPVGSAFGEEERGSESKSPAPETQIEPEPAIEEKPEREESPAPVTESKSEQPSGPTSGPGEPPAVEPEPEQPSQPAEEINATPVPAVAPKFAFRLVQTDDEPEEEEREEEGPPETAEEHEAKAGGEQGGRGEAEDERQEPEPQRSVIEFPRSGRGWDIWELEKLLEKSSDQDPLRRAEQRQILFNLRDHIGFDGKIPPQFDDLVREVFDDLL